MKKSYLTMVFMKSSVLPPYAIMADFSLSHAYVVCPDPAFIMSPGYLFDLKAKTVQYVMER